MFNPLFDASGMTDKELQQKINDQSVRIGQARAAGMSDNIIANMQVVLNQCYDEMVLRQGHKEQSTYEDEDSCVWDMNSYLSDEEDSKKKDESTRKQIYKSQW